MQQLWRLKQVWSTLSLTLCIHASFYSEMPDFYSLFTSLVITLVVLLFSICCQIRAKLILYKCSCPPISQDLFQTHLLILIYQLPFTAHSALLLCWEQSKTLASAASNTAGSVALRESLHQAQNRNDLRGVHMLYCIASMFAGKLILANQPPMCNTH